jgi:hypothetical protein
LFLSAIFYDNYDVGSRLVEALFFSFFGMRGHWRFGWNDKRQSSFWACRVVEGREQWEGSNGPEFWHAFRQREIRC